MMFKLGDVFFDEAGKQYKIIQSKANNKCYILDLEENEIVGEIFYTQLVYSEGETFLT